MKLIAVITSLHLGASLALAATGWPDSARPALTPEITYEPYDGGQIEYLTLKGGGVEFTTGNDVSLKVVEPDSRYSIAFESTRYPGARLGIALFGRSEFLTSIESPSWDNYLASLRYSYGNGVEVVSDKAPEETARDIPIMGAPYRVLTFKYRLDEESPVMMKSQYFIMLKDKLLVASIETPEAYFSAVSQSLRSMLVGLDRRK